jgi:hypothetical protein
MAPQTNQELAVAVAVLENRIVTLEDSCKIKRAKIEALEAFQNKMLGYSMAASFCVTLVIQLWQHVS